VKAILLVGGQGTRLRPLTENRPKALIPILNKPFISYLLDHLKEAGVQDVMFAAGHLAEPIKKIFPTYASKKFRLHFAVEPTPLGTGGAIRFAYDKFKKSESAEPVLVFNGDVLFDLSLTDFINHQVTLKGLEGGVNYTMVIRGKDEFKNEAASLPITFSTKLDQASPNISKLYNPTSRKNQTIMI
jgi:NDP-sugar pyrophosphorylase family protein